jgi:outer membrane protein assembly factor BamD
VRVRFAVPLALALAVSACGGPQSPGSLTYGESARREYERALQAFQDRDCLTAQPLFQNIRREYPYSRYAALAELRYADCELEQAHYTEAIRAYRSFIRQRPTHPDVDDAHFSIALAYFRQIPGEFFLSPPPEERDQASARSALRAVRRFLLDFPDSDHVPEARRIERQVLALLARHELFVANYYLQRDRPQATITRLRTLLDQYEGSGVEPEALLLLGRTYLHMREARQARLAFGALIDRFPESGFATQARNYLRTMGAPPSAEVVDTGEPGDPTRPRRPRPDDDDHAGGRAVRGRDATTDEEHDSEERENDRRQDARKVGVRAGGDDDGGEVERPQAPPRRL